MLWIKTAFGLCVALLGRKTNTHTHTQKALISHTKNLVEYRRQNMGGNYK